MAKFSSRSHGSSGSDRNAFTHVDPPDAAAFVSEGTVVQVYKHQARILLKVPYDVALERISPRSGVLEKRRNGTMLRIGADDLEWLAGFLAGLDCKFQISGTGGPHNCSGRARPAPNRECQLTLPFDPPPTVQLRGSVATSAPTSEGCSADGDSCMDQITTEARALGVVPRRIQFRATKDGQKPAAGGKVNAFPPAAGSSSRSVANQSGTRWEERLVVVAERISVSGVLHALRWIELR